MVRTCKICGTELTGKYKKRFQFCSQPCRHEAANRRVRRYLSQNYEEVKKRNLKYRTENPITYLWSSAKNRAKTKGIEFTISIDYLKSLASDICPILLTPFIKRTPYAMSIDRIDTAKGYIPGNVQIIAKKANTMKNDASPEELLKFADWIYKNYKS